MIRKPRSEDTTFDQVLNRLVVSTSSLAEIAAKCDDARLATIVTTQLEVIQQLHVLVEDLAALLCLPEGGRG